MFWSSSHVFIWADGSILWLPSIQTGWMFIYWPPVHTNIKSIRKILIFKYFIMKYKFRSREATGWTGGGATGRGGANGSAEASPYHVLLTVSALQTGEVRGQLYPRKIKVQSVRKCSWFWLWKETGELILENPNRQTNVTISVQSPV